MNIVIAGAGEVGFHLARLLSNENHYINLIDKNHDRLKKIEDHAQVMVFQGDATSIAVLKDAKVSECDLLIGVTESQNTNLTLVSIGKALGAGTTIARIDNPEFLTTKEIKFSKVGVGHMISPEELAADEIQSLLEDTTLNDKIAFDNGLFNVVGTHLTAESPLIGKTVEEAKNCFSKIDFIVIAIQRSAQARTIIPKGNTLFKVDDQVYFSMPYASLDCLNQLIGKEKSKVKNVMILGGSRIGRKTARILDGQKRKVKIIEPNYEKTLQIADELPDALVVHSDGRDVGALEEESIESMDAFVAVTGHTETNIMTCLLAKSKGVKKTIALVENSDYFNISQTIGIDTLINKKLLAANAIFKHIRKGKVVKVANLQNIDAEVLEFLVRRECKITQKPIKDLELPKEVVIGGVIRDKAPLMTFGDFVIQKGDHVLIFCLPEAIDEVEALFVDFDKKSEKNATKDNLFQKAVSKIKSLTDKK